MGQLEYSLVDWSIARKLVDANAEIFKLSGDLKLSVPIYKVNRVVCPNFGHPVPVMEKTRDVVWDPEISTWKSAMRSWKIGCEILKIGCEILKIGCEILKIGCETLKIVCEKRPSGNPVPRFPGFFHHCPVLTSSQLQNENVRRWKIVLQQWSFLKFFSFLLVIYYSCSMRPISSTKCVNP